MIFPGGVGVSGLRVYDWPAADGLCGGSPHIHLACAEAYVVISGEGAVQSLTLSGFTETELTAGQVVWFPPGTVHRLVNGDGELRLVVVMQNGGLPEAGDAVFTFPPEILADPAEYDRAAACDTPDRARRRRDLAVEGYRALREGGRPAVSAFHEAAHRLIEPKLDAFEKRWRAGALAAAAETGRHLAALRRGDLSHLGDARVEETGPRPRLGMCGNLETYPDL